MKKLDNRGVSHLLVPLLVVVGIAIGGVYMIVGSHADSVTLPLIKSARYTTASTIAGSAVNGQWCGTATLKYTVKLSAGVNPDLIESLVVSDYYYNYDTRSYPDKNKNDHDTALTKQNRTTWVGTVTRKGLCVPKKGDKLTINKIQYQDQSTDNLNANANGKTIPYISRTIETIHYSYESRSKDNLYIAPEQNVPAKTIRIN